MDDPFDPNNPADDVTNQINDDDDSAGHQTDDQVPLKDDADVDDDNISPARKDEEWQEGLEMDDDIDKMAEDIMGGSYRDTEEIDITKKYSPTSKIEPPEEEITE